MVWVATVSLEVLNLAVVVLPLVRSVPWPILVPPSEKVTNPVGLPGPLLVIVAVKVTVCPEMDGPTEEVTLATVVARLTACVSVSELVRKLLSPP
jgi:hypothetical protein